MPNPTSGEFNLFKMKTFEQFSFTGMGEEYEVRTAEEMIASRF